MSVIFKKTIATSLILGLVFPLTSQALTETLGTTVSTDTGTQTSGTQNLSADDNATPRTNLNNLAPTYTTPQVGNTITTITPEIDLFGTKKEGVWRFGVARYGEIASDTIKYDATGPKCAPAPTINEYNNGNDYYAKKDFINPWPLGLNGEWANDIIYFENDDPSICRDQVTIASKTYVQRNYNPNNCANFTYEEDKKDCERESKGQNTIHTLPLSQMSGCKRTDTIQVDTHKSKQDFYMFDKADNNTLCFAPEAKIDTKTPVINAFEAEHVGLRLPKETLSINSSNRTNYRADDGPLLLHVNLKDDDADASSGRSGLNWEPITNNPEIDALESEIRAAENQLNIFISDATAFEADIIFKRSDVLQRLAAIQKHKVSNNLLHKISAEINTNTNFFMQALLSLTPGLNALNATDINEDGITNIQNILNRSKFDDVTNIQTLRSTVTNISRDLINRRKGDYVTELPQLLNRAQVNEVGDLQSLTSTNNEFKEFYNQWQIDKTKNYSSTFPTWSQDLLNIDRQLTKLNRDFESILEAYNSDDLLTLVQELADIIPESSVLSILMDTETSATEHAAEQQRTVQSLEAANMTILNTITYLNSFNDSTDTFDESIISQLIIDLNEAGNNVLGIRGDLRDTETPGTLADSLYRMSGVEEADEFEQLINLENQTIMVLQGELVVKKDELAELQSKLKTKNEAITALEALILTMRSDLADLVAAQQDALNPDPIVVESEVEVSETKTVNEQIEEKCAASGGTVVKDGSTSFCRFSAGKCNGEWSQFKNWSTTKNKDCSTGTCGRDCSTGSHSWKNKARETCTYTSTSSGFDGSCGPINGTYECKSTVQRIGCTVTGLSPITTTRTETVTTIIEPPTLNEEKITHIEITRSDSVNNKSQQFFPPNTVPESGNNFVWDINSFRFEGESAPIFTVAGNYKVTVRAFDQATNKLVKNGYIQVFPAKLEVDVNSNCNNASNIRYADNSETCSLSMPLLDRFGNKVQANKDITISVRDQDVNGSYNLVKSLGAGFVNGLRFVGGSNSGKQNVLTWKPLNQANKTIQLKSLLPTLKVTEYGADTDYAIGYEVDDGVNVAFTLEHPNIGPRGSSLSTPYIDTLDIPVRFKPWVNVKAKGSNGTFVNRGWNPPIAQPFDIYVDAGTNSSKKLPTAFAVNVTGFVGSSYDFNNEDLAKPGKSITFSGVNTAYTESTGNAGKPAPFTTTINSISALSSQQSSRALFIPQVVYQAGGENIVLPGIPAGTCPDDDPEKCFVIEPADPADRVDINISNAATNEPGNLSFTINLSQSIPERDLTVYLEAEHVSTSSGDFTMPSQNFVTIPAGASSASFNIQVNDDDEVEADETLRLKVQNVDKPELVDQKTAGIGTIYDDDNALEISDISAIEGARCMFSFALNRPASEDVIITTTYGAPTDSAQGGAGNDYDNTNGTFTIPAGQTRVIAPVQTYEDEIAEGNETFTLVVDRVQGGDLSALTAETTCEIEDNDIEPNIYLTNTNVIEGQNAPITVILGENGPSGRPDNEDVVVRLRTYELDSSSVNAAKKDSDYVHKTFDVTIPANQKSVTVAPANGIVTNTDDLIEGDEVFGVEIVGIANGAKVGARNAKATITIEDGSTPPAKPSIEAIAGQTGYEKTPNDTVQFTVTLNTENETGSPINLTLNLQDDTAEGGTGKDYDNTPVTVSIPDGEKSGTSAPIEIYNDDEVESTEYFNAIVAGGSVSPAGALIGTFPTGQAQIKDEDLAPIDITIEDSIACESVGCANASDNVMNFKVKLSRAHLDETNPLIVSFEPSKVTPTANDYFVVGEYKATFNYLDTEAQLEPVLLINNLDVDGDKEFQMSFKAVESSHSSSIGDTSDTAKGTIQDDDGTGQPEIIITEASETEGNTAVIKVGLTTPAIDETTITLNTRNISTEDADYSCDAEQLTVIFGVGEMESQEVVCDLLLDDENEPEEQFEVEVGTVTGTIKPGGDNDKGVITITNYQTLDLVMEQPPVFMENTEGGKALFNFSLKDNGNNLAADQILESPINFTIEPEDITAVGGSNFAINGIDYRNSIMTVNLEPGKGEGKTDVTLEVDINDDSVVEVDSAIDTYPENRHEAFSMPIDTASGNVRSVTTFDGVIEDNDRKACNKKPKVQVVDDALKVEGQNLVFDVLLDRSLCRGEEINLQFETQDGSAKAGSDYVAKTFNLKITAGNRRPPLNQRIVVQTNDDTVDENNEYLRIKYVDVSPSDSIQKVERFSIRSDRSHRNRGTVNKGGVAAVGTIVDNDTAGEPIPSITISDAIAEEGEDLLYEVRLSGTNQGETIEAEFEASAGDANTSAADFSSAQVQGGRVLATMVIENGEQIGTLKTTIIKHAVINTTENSVEEPDKKVDLDFNRLISGVMQTVGIVGGLGTIEDDDTTISKPSVTISDGSANEGEEITFTISLENSGSGTTVAPRGGINFEISTSTNTGPNAAEASEFEQFTTSTPKVVSLTEGASSVSFKVKTNVDDIEENPENFNVQIQASNAGTFLANAAAITAGNVNGTGTINDVTAPDECALYGINCPAEEIILPGAAIEGQIIADKIVCLDEDGNEKDDCDVTQDDSIVLGTSTVATDIREEITRNASELIRGRTAANIGDIPMNTSNRPIIERNDTTINSRLFPRWDIYVDDLPDGGVTYLDGDLNGDGNITGNETRSYFRIGLHRNGSRGSLGNPVRVSGKHTFIVKNASLNIVGDMVYDNPDSSLGIMVINDSIDNLDDLSRRGQLTIFKDVKYIVGALFTDGSLVSNISAEAGAGHARIQHALSATKNDDWDVPNRASRLGRQLILTGNILSKNTIGKADKAIPEGPWGDLSRFPAEQRQVRAQMYDFNYIRRYVPEYDSPGVLSAASKNLCSKLPGQSECYENIKSFIIRVDPRLRENPPPGFQAKGIQSLR